MDRRTLIAGGAAVVALGGAGAYWTMRQGQAPAVTKITAATTEGASDIDTSGIVEMVQGADDAPVTLMEYASFTCPHCATFHEGPYKKLKSEYIETGKVKFIYRDVYFDRFGLWAAMLARCDPNRFFGIASLLYERQKEWLDAESPSEIANNLRRLGKTAGLSDDQIEECLSDQEKARTLVAWFEKNAAEDDVTATPTLFIDGTKHSNMAWPDLKALLDEALEA